MKKNSGFTLMELAIAMAILMVVVGVVLIGASGDNNDYRTLYNATLTLQADMRYAQRRAIIEGRRFSVDFEPSHNRYRIVKYDYIPGRYVVRTVYLQNGVVFLDSSSQNFRVQYLPRGTVSGSTSIYFRSGRFAQRVTITVAGGQVRLAPIVSE